MHNYPYFVSHNLVTIVKRVIDPVKRYSKMSIKITMFVIAAGMVLYMLPRSGKFKYEYANGRFWKHNVLIAGFDFPIIKTSEQIKTERDSLFRYFRPYFVTDSTISETEITEFDNWFEHIYPELNGEYAFLRSSAYLDKPTSSPIARYIHNQLRVIHRKGIIELTNEFTDVKQDFEFKLIKGNIAEPFGISEVYSPKSAYSQLANNIKNYLIDSLNLNASRRNEEINSFVSKLQLNRFLAPSIKYDKQRSDVERLNIQKQLSTTEGAIKMGQRIIGTGEIIDDRMIQILDSYKVAFESNLASTAGYSQILIGQILIVLSFFAGILLFLFFFRRDVYENNISVLFILLMVFGMVMMAKISNSFHYIPIFVIPFAILPITIRTFFDSRLALFIHIMTILLSSFFAPNGFQFAFIQILAGITAIFSLYSIERRSQLLRASIYITLVYALLYTALFLWQEGDIKKIEPFVYGHFALNGALLLLTYLVIFIFEKLFGFLSDVTLAELSNTNHPLLLKLAEQTPGTFHHSIQVGNLAVAAIKKIGGNPLLVYAGAMYHDIGKMENPSLYTENQISGYNPLLSMEYDKGAQLVISHIENGVKLAHKHKLPQQLIDFIVTHQGTTKTKYFFNSFINKYPDQKPDLSLFTYPGPIPFTKETAVLMMADSIEAASRSLSNYSDTEVDKLVERIIADQIEQGQLMDAPITFKELTIIKEVFKQRLKIMYHTRIQYPEIKKSSK